MKNNCAVNETAKVLQLRKCSFERFALIRGGKSQQKEEGGIKENLDLEW